MISPGKTVVLTFDDAVSNHAAFAAPLLSELGFHATFFICEFPPDFAVNKRQYMTWEQIRSLDAAGFEIANHTMTHAGLSAMAPETCEKEIELLEARFRDVGLPRSRAFGYPGGPAADYAPPLLKKARLPLCPDRRGPGVGTGSGRPVPHSGRRGSWCGRLEFPARSFLCAIRRHPGAGLSRHSGPSSPVGRYPA